MFTLQVIDDENLSVLRANTESRHGGTDLFQAAAFNHLFPEGYCLWVYRELLYFLAELHGWNVKVTALKRKKEPKSEENHESTTEKPATDA